MLRAKIAGTLRVWYGDVGDFVEPDEIIAEIETPDGTYIEIAAPAAGRITEIHTLVGESVENGTLLAQLDEAPQVLYDLLDGGQKPKRKIQRKAPSRRRFLLILGALLLLVLGGMAAMFLMVTPTSVSTKTSFATPVSQFNIGDRVVLRQVVGSFGRMYEVDVIAARFDGEMWWYSVSSDELTAEVPAARLSALHPPAPTPTLFFSSRRWAWSNPLILAESVADFSAGTRVRITSASFDGVAWQLDVLTESGFVLRVREAQLAFPSDPPANPLATPAPGLLNNATWNSYVLKTIEQVGDIPANTLVRVISAHYGFDGWIYTVISKGDPTGVEALESQLAFASETDLSAP